MKNAFLILNYNDSDTTIKLINNIKDYKIIDVILVVDNNSKDNSFEVLKQYENDKIEVIKTEDNKGYGYGNNYGIKYLIKKYGELKIAISNPDVEINSEADLEKLYTYLDEENIGIVSCTVLENNNLNRGWKLKKASYEISQNVFLINKLFKKFQFYKDEHYQNNVSKVDIVTGCFFLIKSKTMEKIDFFDENVFLYYEENILAKKLQREYKETIVVNDIKVKHNHSITIDKNIKKLNKYKQLKKSQYYFQTKYNNAFIITRFFLKLTANFTGLILNLKYKLRSGE